MAIHHNYYDDWHGKDYSCKCGWSGVINKGDLELYDALADFDCPKCETKLLIVSYPTTADIKEAASDGNEEAKQQLKQIKEFTPSSPMCDSLDEPQTH